VRCVCREFKNALVVIDDDERKHRWVPTCHAAVDPLRAASFGRARADFPQIAPVEIPYFVRVAISQLN